MKGYLLTLIGALLLLTLDSAEAHSLGRMSVGATPSGALRADFKRGSKFTLSEAGTAHRICAYLDGGGSASGVQSFRYALYKETGGVPDVKIAESEDSTIGAGAPARWLCLRIGWTPMTAGNYWLMIHTGGTTTNGPARYFYDGVGNYLTNADAFSDGTSEQFGTVGAGDGTISIYAEYTPGSVMQNVGRTTIGSTPSGVLRPDFKRGSSITFPTSGKVTAFTAFLDGAGGPDQPLRFALYKDVNGVPGPLVVQSLEGTFSAVSRRNWVTLFAPETVVSAGKYWLMLHTGGTSGSLRYYYSGTGNWLGNADAYADGASTPFGTAGAGNGTISAFASYQPNAPIANVFGRTTVASRPLYFSLQRGLGSAYMHVTQFELPVNATMTALYGYLDGLGSTSGSQQVRMVIYGNDVWLPSGLKAVSNVITINAGRQPGWVKFDIPPTPLPPGTYHIGIHTGNSPFIVRSYGDPPGTSQENGEDTFEDGPNDNTLNTDSEVSGFGAALSVYATYTAN